MREISARYTPRFARLVSRVSSRTSSSTTSTSGSSGSSGTASSASRLLIRLVFRLFDVSDVSRHRQHVERVVDAAVAADLEVHMIVRRTPGAAHACDALARRHPVADLDEVFVVVRVHGGEAELVVDLQHASVARLDAGHDDHARPRPPAPLPLIPPTF